MTAEGPAEPRLTPEERAALERGVSQFDHRLFYECHDTLEELWSGQRGPARDFLQGLIQAAVGFYHLGNGNRSGAVRLFDRALTRLAPFPVRYAGLDTAALREALPRWRAAAAGEGDLPDEAPPRLPVV